MLYKGEEKLASLLVEYSVPLSVIVRKLKEVSAEYNKREVAMHAPQYLFLDLKELEAIDGETVKKAIEGDIKWRYDCLRPY